jgi:hypothetical protein
MRFTLGEVVATPSAIRFLGEQRIDIFSLLLRHSHGDWGDLEAEDKTANERAVESGARILSAFETPKGKVWVLTTAQDDYGKRESTCVLLPSEH